MVSLDLPQAEICSDEFGLTISGGMPEGGSYSGIGVSGNYFDVTVAGIGVHEISYTFTDPTGCDNVATATIEVHALPDVQLFLTEDEQCPYDTALSLGGGTPFGEAAILVSEYQETILMHL